MSTLGPATSAPVPPTPTQSSVSSTTPTSIVCIRAKDLSREHQTYDLLKEDNWQSWCKDIDITFNVCSLHEYVDSTLPCPDAAIDLVGASNWRYNNECTHKVICDHMS
jgi:hypothetical protein